nr:unnamed protein product [Callosobruchus analis]
MYYWCIVPECKNTSISTPEKVFIKVPTEEQGRKQWIVAVSREDISRQVTFVCEDRFDVSKCTNK